MSAKKKRPARAAAWRNRIVGTAMVDPHALTKNPSNWRAHGQKQSDAMDAVLSEIGWVQQIIVNKRTGHMLDGEMRMNRALKKGEKLVPVTYVDVSAAEEKKILLTFNAIGEMADKEKNSLETLLREVKFENTGIEPLLLTLAQEIHLDGAGRNRDEVPEVSFAEELLEEHNYVVLYFDNSVDWTHAQSILDLKKVKASFARKGIKHVGIGRVMRGQDAIRKIQEAAK